MQPSMMAQVGYHHRVHCNHRRAREHELGRLPTACGPVVVGRPQAPAQKSGPQGGGHGFVEKGLELNWKVVARIPGTCGGLSS